MNMLKPNLSTLLGICWSVKVLLENKEYFEILTSTSEATRDVYNMHMSDVDFMTSAKFLITMWRLHVSSPRSLMEMAGMDEYSIQHVETILNRSRNWNE